MTKIRPFHLAFPIFNIKQTKKWYTKVLGCTIGRQNLKWIDFNFFGHQISGHLIGFNNSDVQTNVVDGYDIPVRHFGIILRENEWKKLSEKVISNNCEFVIKPNVRFKGKKGEQSTFFIKDPSGNVLEFKAFKNDEMIFDN